MMRVVSARAIYVPVVLALSGLILVTELPDIVSAMHARPGDCTVHWLAARSFWRGKSPYSQGELRANLIEQYGYPHPPTVSFWFLGYAPFDVDPFGKIANYITLAVLLTLIFLIVIELN